MPEEPNPTVTVRNGYNRKELIKLRAMSKAEGLALHSGQEIACVSSQGEYRRLKVNGRVRTWKRSPHRIEIPCKYGLYEYATFIWSPSANTYLSFDGTAYLAVLAEEGN